MSAETNRKVHAFGIDCPSCGENVKVRKTCMGDCLQHKYLDFYHSFVSCSYCSAEWVEIGKNDNLEAAHKSIYEANDKMNRRPRTPPPPPQRSNATTSEMGLFDSIKLFFSPSTKKAVAAAVTLEREECAKIAEATSKEIAKKIRSRT